jgi:predicted PurR-regulated permease PerM
MDAAASRGVPLRTIVAAVAVVAATCLLAILAYRLRAVLLLILAGSFVAAILDPVVVGLQRWIPRRGLAVTVVVAWSVLVFAGLAVGFGFPLASGLTHFARELPSYVHQAQHGRGWLGHILARFHIQAWARHNVHKLRNLGHELTGPALRLGKGAASLLFDLFTILALTFLFLLEGPKLQSGFLSLMAPARAEHYARVMREMSRTVSGYMLGNLLTSLIAGLVVLIDLVALGVPYPFLWGLWVALVDFLPMIGGALAGIPTVLFATVHSLRAGIVTLIVFVVYTQVENHFLNPAVMSRTVRINPLLVLVSVLVAGAIGNWLGGTFGAFVAALIAIPTAASLQIAGREIWRTAPAEQARPAKAPRDAPPDSS